MNFIRKPAVLTFQQQQVLFPMKSANNFAFLFHSGRILDICFPYEERGHNHTATASLYHSYLMSPMNR